MFGFLNINKPSGLTSRDVVNRVQRLVRPYKCGHAGTLDPLASGVLVVGVGPATRLIQYVQQSAKRYVADFLLGHESDTEDTEGQVREVAVHEPPSTQQLELSLRAFDGEIMQKPPAYSALKVNGKRAYDLSRRGQSVDLAPRPVTIHHLSLREYCFPRFTIEISCGAGTYVRSLGRDIARALGTEAVMTALDRTAVGDFRVSQAVDYDALISGQIERYLQSPSAGIAHLQSLTITADEINELGFGRCLPHEFTADAGPIAAFDAAGRLHAIVAPRDKSLQPIAGFTHYYR